MRYMDIETSSPNPCTTVQNYLVNFMFVINLIDKEVSKQFDPICLANFGPLVDQR